MAHVTLPATGTGDAIIPVAVEVIAGENVQLEKLLAGKAGSTAPIGHLEDDPHVSQDAGIMALSVRADAAAATTSADGDYQPLTTDANARLHVRAVADQLPTALGSNGGLKIEGVAGAVAVPVSAPVGTPLFVEISDGVNPVTPISLVDNSAFVDNSSKIMPVGFVFDEVAGTALTENDIGTPRIDSKRAAILVLEDATTRGQRGSVTTRGSLLTEGAVAHDAADAGNPQKNGGRAMTTARTAVSDADRVDAAFDVQGRQITERDGPRELDAIATLTLTSTTTETSLLAAVASTFLDIIDVLVINSSATACRVDFRDDTAGTIRFFVFVPAGDTRGFSMQRWPQAIVNKPWTAQCSASVASIQIAVRARKTK